MNEINREDFFENRFILETLPPRGTNPDKYIAFCKEAVDYGAQVIAVTDLPMGSARVSPIAPAHMLSELGFNVLMHFSRTTRNAIRIEGDLIAAHMLGIKNLLILSGDDPRVGTYPFSSSIEDFSIYDVFKLTKLLNEKGEDLAGLKIYGSFSFNPGGVFSPFEKDLNQTLERMELKIQNGCSFFVSQPIFNADTIIKFLEKSEAEEIFKKTKIYIALMVFESFQQLEHFSKVPGVYVPKEYFRQKDDSHLEEYSKHQCVSIIEKLAPYVHGFYLTSTTRKMETIKVVSDAVMSQY
ncbi:methylenetetrahydrofolate reductase [Fervidobacterium islandicum]|uniref:Methylenetetrahydrofolate reductase n=1 Tax=Fervidobacterium islandicum TaxID=2423 RepID=A0AAI8CMY2_FERIS|nr:methylenetetrahydrofolate reductase [Fervidobacterium islandicum]AMW33367.1 methylenetetrahydrofolate reductase [Fervidobacterium islandicum]